MPRCTTVIASTQANPIAILVLILRSVKKRVMPREPPAFAAL